MNFSRIPSLALLLVGSSLAFAPALQAGGSNKSGNPYGNGTQFPNGGTFTAIMRGQNLMGVTQFSTFGGDANVLTSGWNMLNGQSGNAVSAITTNGPTSANTNSIPGFVSLYYNGTTYNGPAFSVLNMAANEIASVFYTYNAGMQTFDPGAGLTLNQSSPDPAGSSDLLYVTNTTVTITGSPNNLVTNTITTITTTNYTTAGSGGVATTNRLFAGSYNYYDGNWAATFANKYPNQTFSGKGVISLGQPANVSNPSPINQPNGGNNVVQIPFTVTGTRVISSQSTIF